MHKQNLQQRTRHINRALHVLHTSCTLYMWRHMSDLAGAVVEVVPLAVGVPAEGGIVAASQHARVTLEGGGENTG